MTPRRRASEASLVRAARRGSEDAVAELFARHWSPAHRAALLVTGDAAAAEDIAQEAFVAALRALESFDLRRPLRPWLHRIVVNRAIDFSRARALRAELGADAARGARRRLGDFSGASWSPRGLYVVAWRGRQLTALEPDGDVRWSLSAPAPVTHAAWSPVDGFRIAYVAGGSLRVVTGDGKEDRRYAPARDVTPAWRPDDAHVLAYVDRRERINVVAVDSGRRLWRTQRLTGVKQLAWAPGGRKLLAAAGDRVTRFDARHRATGATIVDWVPGAAYAVEHMAVAPRSGRIAVVRAADSGRREVRLERTLSGGRLLFTARGPLPGLAWSPDGRRLLVPWPDADQWIFLRPGGGGRPVAVANIARQFMPGASEPAFPDSVQWCCP